MIMIAMSTRYDRRDPHSVIMEQMRMFFLPFLAPFLCNPQPRVLKFDGIHQNLVDSVGSTFCNPSGFHQIH
jgi:hypothetical protein